MIEVIRARLPELSAAERRVAELVLAHPNRVTHAPVAQIADEAGVSQPTVIRFCRTMECRGLQDFKLRLARGLVAGVPFVHSAVDRRDGARDLAAKLFDNTVASLIRARNELNTEAVAQAIEILARARRIEFYGLGNSGIIAQDAQHKFFRLGVPCIAYSDPHIHGMSASLLSRGDVVVAISNSGRTVDILRSVELAREAGASVIAITHSNSPLARLCDVALYADTPEDPDLYPPMITRIIHLVIVDTLAVGVALRGGAKLVDQLERIKSTLRERRVRGYEEPESLPTPRRRPSSRRAKGINGVKHGSPA